MSRFARLALVCSAMCLAGLTGCGGSTPSTATPGRDASNGEGDAANTSSDSAPSDSAPSDSAPSDTVPNLSKEVKRYDMAELGLQPGEYMPPLDNQRIEIAPPEGWDWKRPGAPYLTGFCETGGSINSLPRILISAEDNPFGGFDNVTEANMVDFAVAVAEQLADETLLAPVQPMVLGDVACARYVKLGRKNNAAVGQQVILAVANGRLYTVQLEAIKNQFQTHRDAGYAAVASLKFKEPGDTPPTQPAEVEPPQPATKNTEN